MKNSRRAFLKGIVIAGIVPAMQPALLEAASKKTTKNVTVFRFQVRKTQHCKACGIHHKYKIYLSRAFADQGRAHPGCNCPIVPQKISQKKFEHLFVDTGADKTGSVDLRFLGKV